MSTHLNPGTILNYKDTHRDLIEKCKTGNRKAQFELYKLYSKAMYNICLRMLKHETDAEDILQQSFIDVFTKLHTFQYQSSIGAWIKRIVINNCINFLKRNRKFTEELQDWHTKDMVETETVDNEMTAYSVQKIKKAMKKLPAGYRSVFSLYLIEGYDHKEIGEILGISEATSKSQYSRAKQKIRLIIGSC